MNDANNVDFLTSLKENPLATVADYYAKHLSDSPKAIEFAKEELNLTEEQLKEKQIGFSDRTLGKQLPSSRVKAGRELRESLREIGLYKANGHETLRGYVTEPIRDEAGNVVGLRGHKVDRHAGGPATIVIGESGVGFQPANESTEPTTKETNNTNEPTAKPQTNDADELQIEDGQIIVTRDDRRYRIRGLEKNHSIMQLKVNLMVSRDSLVHVDTLDLVKARSRTSFIKAAASELYTDADTIKKDIGFLLLGLETLNSDRIARLKNPATIEVKLTDEEQAEALKLLRDPNLLERIVADAGACGMVGEATNKLAGYLAATSRKLDKPLAIVIQSSSSAGKISLMDSILAMMPGEDVQRYSGEIKRDGG